MYGKYVTLSNSEQEITVFVPCTPDTSKKELVKIAKKIIMGMN